MFLVKITGVVCMEHLKKCNLVEIFQSAAWVYWTPVSVSLQWRHNERDGVSIHRPHDCLLSRLFRHVWNKTSKLCVTGLDEGNSPVTREFPAQMASNAENVSIWWRHHVKKVGVALSRLESYSKDRKGSHSVCCYNKDIWQHVETEMWCTSIAPCVVYNISSSSWWHLAYIWRPIPLLCKWYAIIYIWNSKLDEG